MVEYVLSLWKNPEKYTEASNKIKQRALYIESTQKQAWKDFIDLLEIKEREKV